MFSEKSARLSIGRKGYILFDPGRGGYVPVLVLPKEVGEGYPDWSGGTSPSFWPYICVAVRPKIYPYGKVECTKSLFLCVN